MSVKPVDDAQFIKLWNNTDNYPNIRSIANDIGKSYDAIKGRAKRLKASGAPLVDRSGLGGPQTQALIPEMRATYFPKMSEADLISSMRAMQVQFPDLHITRMKFRKHTGISDSTWNRYFGTFLEFRRQAGLELNRNQHALERQIGKHVSADNYRAFNDRADLGSKYNRDSASKYKTVITCSDLHDEEIDPFYLRVLLAAIRMVQPDVVNLAGDIFDLPEFGRFTVDPREWDPVGKIKFVHNNILGPIREAAPNAQLDFVEGNHEYRLLRHLADQTPALKAVLADLLGLTVPKLLGLDQFEINYIAKADLAAFNKGDQKNEVEKSYVIYDDAFLVHHHPHARSWGLPGVNGHHHAWKVFHQKNALTGAYQWIQMGCGHRLRASYAEGEFWSLGFNIAHINTVTKSVTHEYISVTDLAVVGGLFFHRNEDEKIGEFSRR